MPYVHLERTWLRRFGGRCSTRARQHCSISRKRRRGSRRCQSRRLHSQSCLLPWLVLTWIPKLFVASAFEARMSIPRVFRRVNEATYPRRVSSPATKYSPAIPDRVRLSLRRGLISNPGVRATRPDGSRLIILSVAILID